MKDFRIKDLHISAYYFALTFILVLISNILMAQSKSKCKPDVKIHVNKQTDEFGNVIKYDSIYMYSWNHTQCMTDSILKEVERFFSSEQINKHIENIGAMFPNLMRPKANINNSMFGDFLNEQLEYIDSVSKSQMMNEFFNFESFEGFDEIIEHQKKMMMEFKKLHEFPPHHKLDSAHKIKQKPKYIKPIHEKERFEAIDI